MRIFAFGLLALAACQGTYKQHGIDLAPIDGTPIAIRYVDGVEPPEHIDDAARAIDQTLDTYFGPDWPDLADVAIEWLPYGAVVKGEYITTGFVTRGPATRAVGQPTFPISDATVAQVARVVGTIRIEYPLPRPLPSKARCTALIMDMRKGVSPREVLEGTGGEKPRVDAGATSLFYEVAWRIAPLCLDDINAAVIDSKAARYQAIEDAIKIAYRAAVATSTKSR